MINKRLSIYTQPSIEPVSLTSVKDILKIDSSDEDSLLTSLIETARYKCEQYVRRAFITQTLELSISAIEGNYIELWCPPIIQIDSLTSYDSSNVPTILDPSNYSLIEDKLVFSDTAQYPSELRSEYPIVIRYKAGYGAAVNNVPQSIKTAILYQARALYEGCGSMFMPVMVRSLLDPFRILRLN